MTLKVSFGIILLIFFWQTAFCQNETDALRFSSIQSTGTARFTSMAGAFGALGGDFSASTVNPAGIAIYRSSELTISPSLYYKKTNSAFSGNSSVDYKYDFNLGNFGFVSSFVPENEENDWKSTSFSVGYNHNGNLGNNTIIEGQNQNNSMIDYFVKRANGTQYNNLDYYMEGLAFDIYLIDTLNGSTTQYFSQYLSPGTYNQTQRKEISTKGSLGEYNFSIASNFRHQLYLGASISIHRIKYEENSTFSENAPGDILSNLESFSYTQNIVTSGTGYSFKIGAILRPIDWLRIGASLHSPTLYSMEDNFSGSMEKTQSDGVRGSAGSDSYLSTYELTTPIKTCGSLGFVINKTALIGIDYEYVDYQTARLRDDKMQYSFQNENKAIQNKLKPVSNIKAGGEYSFNNFRIRAGMAFYGSPYKNSELNKNAYILAVTGGFGIRSNNFFLDFAISKLMKSEQGYFYRVSENTDNFKTDFSSNQLIITAGIKF